MYAFTGMQILSRRLAQSVQDFAGALVFALIPSRARSE